MNPLSIHTFMSTFIIACSFMGGAFIFNQKQGNTFINSFDKSIAWGSGLFVVSYCLNLVIYVLL